MQTIPQKLILASASKTRKRMLENAGINVETCPPATDEDALKASMIAANISPRSIADGLADAKARSVSMLRPEGLILGADQILELDGNILSKVNNVEDATAKLKRLSARTHQLHSAAVIYENGQPVWRAVETATMSVRPLSDNFIDSYLANLGDDAFWSVGAYQLEGLGIQLFEKIKGDYFVILGLPLVPVLDFLRRREIIPL